MPSKALQSRLRALAERHREALSSLIDQGDKRAEQLYRGLAKRAGDSGVWTELREGLADTVQAARAAARSLSDAHFRAELAATIGASNATKIELDAGAVPSADDVAEYVNNAVDATRDDLRDIEDDKRAEAFEHNVYRAKTIIESEATVQYKKSRDALNSCLLALSDDEAEDLGFITANTQAQLNALRAEPVELRDDQNYVAIVGERWDARASACDRCKSADGEVRPIGFSFSQPGPTVHARCQCVRTLWAVLVPWPSKERNAMPHDSTQPGGNAGPGIDRSRLAWFDVQVEVRALKVDEAKRTIRGCVFSDESIDSHGSKIIAKGWKLERFNSNPSMQWNHAWARWSAPAKPEDMLGNGENVHVKGKQLIGDLRFDPPEINPCADMVYRQMLVGTVRNLSVGFAPRKYHYESQGEGQRDLLVIDEAELLEISPVPLGANENAGSGIYGLRGDGVRCELRDLCPPILNTVVDAPASDEPRIDVTNAQPAPDKGAAGAANSVVGDSQAAGAKAGACPESHARESLMDKTILEVFGLKAEAPETEVLAAATRQRDQLASLITLLGADSYDAAVGKFRALASVAAKVPELEKCNADLLAAGEQRDRTDLIREHAAKFTPAELSETGWVKSASLEALRAFCKSAPDRVATTPTTQPAVHPKRELTPEQRKVCKSAGMTEEDFVKALEAEEGGA